METHKTYDVVVDTQHRRKYGQFFTPLDVASFMCRWALDSGAPHLFDPAFGLGVFYEAARKINQRIQFGGSEIDPVILKHSQQLWPSSSCVANEDYLSSWGKMHEAIVCNPPYMRFQNFKNRGRISELFQQNLNVRLSGYTNSASAFLLKSLSELRPGGRLAYIMPLEFLNTGYGELIKQQLLQKGRLKAVISLEAEKEVFPDAITSIGIVLVANDGKSDAVKFYSLNRIADLGEILQSEPIRSVPVAQLSPSEKWLKYFEPESSVHLEYDSLVDVKTFGGFSRGIATGANEFFVMSPSKARELRLPSWALSKCITRSSQVKTSVFSDDDFEKLADDDRDILLLDVNGRTTPSVIEYIRAGEEQGFNHRYLTKMRRPWFKVEKRDPAPLLFAVFSREKFKVIRNHCSAVNLTCFHGFYPNAVGQHHLDKLFLYFQSRTARQILSLNMRRYGDGLEKFEPNDLNHALAPEPSWFEKLPESLVREGLEACKAGEALPNKLEKEFSSLLSST